MSKAILILTLASAGLFAQTYEIDTARSTATFMAKHMMITDVTGRFSNVQGKVTINEKQPAKSSVEAVIDTTTVNTNLAKRDTHLKSPDFLDIAKYPTMSFKSTKVYREGSNTRVEGMLTLHGVTKPVTLSIDELGKEIKSEAGTIGRRVVAKTKISRREFGLLYNKLIETGGVVVGDEILITLEIELSRKAS